jgi:hypothetical protein
MAFYTMHHHTASGIVMHGLFPGGRGLGMNMTGSAKVIRRGIPIQCLKYKYKAYTGCNSRNSPPSFNYFFNKHAGYSSCTLVK